MYRCSLAITKCTVPVHLRCVTTSQCLSFLCCSIHLWHYEEFVNCEIVNQKTFWGVKPHFYHLVHLKISTSINILKVPLERLCEAVLCQNQNKKKIFLCAFMHNFESDRDWMSRTICPNDIKTYSSLFCRVLQIPCFSLYET